MLHIAQPAGLHGWSSTAGVLVKPCHSMWLCAQASANELKAREDAVSGNERRLDAESRSLQQQRQEAELAGMKAQLAVQQQQQHSPVMSPLLQANPQLLGGRTASRLQVSSDSVVLVSDSCIQLAWLLQSLEASVTGCVAAA